MISLFFQGEKGVNINQVLMTVVQVNENKIKYLPLYKYFYKKELEKLEIKLVLATKITRSNKNDKKNC